MYQIKILSYDGLEGSEIYLLDFFKSISDEPTSSAILKERKDAPDDFNKAMQKYFDMVDEALIEKGLDRKNNTKRPFVLILLSLIFLVLNLILVSSGQVIAIVSVCLSILLAALETIKAFKKTESGEKLQRQYLSLIDESKNSGYQLQNGVLEFITLIGLGLSNDKLIEWSLAFDLPDYKTIFDCNNLIFANKKSGD